MAGAARIEGRLELQRSVLDGGTFSHVHGHVTALQLIHARVAGEVFLNGAEINAPRGWAVSAGGLVTEGGVFCRNGFTARGEIRLMGAQLPGGLFMQGARLENPGGVVLSADNMATSTLDCSQGFTAQGTVTLRSVRISGLLTFEGATLSGGGSALTCTLMQAEDFNFTPVTPPLGAVDLRGAQVTLLCDTDQSWPERVHLEGFVYGSIRSEQTSRKNDVNRRLEWIRRNPGYVPQAYKQLADWYRQIGQDDDARRVLLAKQRQRRRTLRPAGRVWGRLLDATVGYGYRPWLAGIWLVVLTLLGTLVFGAHAPTAVKPGESAPFQPFVYTLDLLVPIGNLGQRSAWYWADSPSQWLAYTLIAAGWVLTTAVVAGVSRTLSKD